MTGTYTILASDPEGDDTGPYGLSFHRLNNTVANVVSGANVAGAIKWAKQAGNENNMIVTIICDFGERYVQTKLFDGCRYEGSDEIAD